jgi:hypothetical protein
LLRWIADQESPASSQASTAAASIGQRARTQENWPEQGSSMRAPLQSGPASRLMTRLTPTVRLAMLLSSRSVWASRPPSVNTLRAPSVLPRSNPNTYLLPNQRVSIGLPTTYKRKFARGLADEAFDLAREFCWHARRNR